MSKKEKLLISAQKNLQKGQVAKAIKDYQQIVQMTPGDVRNRQKLAELLGRDRRLEEALGEYEAVAKSYADGGFYLKAIAVYKQMQKLDPEKPGIYRRLAELNEKQGLLGNALAEYRNLLAYYEKQGLLQDAIGILQKMREIEPENINILVRLFETYFKDGLKAKAKEVFGEAQALLKQRGDSARLLKLSDVFVHLCPNDLESNIGLAEALIGHGEVQKGLELLKGLLHEQPDHGDILKLLARGYGEAGDYANARLTFQHLLRGTPEDLGAREGFIRACIDGGDADRALGELREWQDAFRSGGMAASVNDLFAATGHAPPHGEPLAVAPPAGLPAEAEELSAEELLSADDLEEIEELEALDDLEEEPAPADELDEIEELADLDDLEELEEIPLEFLEEVAPGEEPAPEEFPPAAPVVVAEEEAEPADAEETFELELELELEEDAEPVAVAAEGTIDLRAELEEADFYLQQGLLEEAERVCQALLASDPACAEALSRLDEIAGRRASQPAAGGEVPFDLAAELADEDFSALDEEFGGLADSQRGVETTIDSEDTESHYNLGIAYKEMGLLDEAVSEFEKALGSPERRVACLTLKGICLATKGDFRGGEEALKAALALPGLNEGERISLLYELGLLYDGCGRTLEALDSFQSVADIDLFFRDVGDKVQTLRKKLGLDGDDDSGESGPRGNKDRVSYV